MDPAPRSPNGFLSALAADDFELIRQHLRTTDLVQEHVLVELERNEEARIVSELRVAQTDADDLVAVLSLLVRHVVAAERRLGPVVFRDMLGLHFSTNRPVDEEVAEHPLAEFVIAAITTAQGAGWVSSEADAAELGVFFMTGLFALLATSQDVATADAETP